MDPIWELKKRKVLVHGGSARNFLKLRFGGLENVNQLCDYVAMIDKIDDLSFGDSDLSDAGLVKLEKHQRISKLSLTYSKLSPEGYALLKPEWGLVELHVNPEQDPDLVARYVSKLSTLEIIGFQDCELTDEGLKEFSKLTRLGKLSVERTKIHKSLSFLVDRCPLTRLAVGETEVDDDACIAISKMRKLNELFACDAKITDKGLGLIAELPDLKLLAIGNPRITSRGLAAIGQIPKLKRLYLSSINLGDPEVEMLCNLTSLEYLFIISGEIDKTDVDKIGHQLPKCDVVSKWDFDEPEQCD